MRRIGLKSTKGIKAFPFAIAIFIAIIIAIASGVCMASKAKLRDIISKKRQGKK